MIKINALNDISASESEGIDGQIVITKEAQEEAAYCLYNKALEFQKQGNKLQAEEVFKQLLQTRLIANVGSREDEEGPLSPAHTLKYLACKNMASIATEKEDYNAAMESYLEAADIDSTDVSLWYRMGLVALKLHNYPLARLSFQEGLKCNPKHWPCLDNLITVLYALNDYANCLYYISVALERECYFTKGLAFRDQIYKEHTGLRSFCEGYFKNCDQSIYTTLYDKNEGQTYIDEALAMREKKRELSKTPPLPVLKFKQPLTDFKWKQLGERLISLYTRILNSNPRISFGCRVNLSMYLDDANKSGQDTKLDHERRPPSPTTVSSSSEAYSIPSVSPASVPTSQSSQHVQLCSQEKQNSGGEGSVLIETDDSPVASIVTSATNVEMKVVQPEMFPYIERERRCGRRRGPKRKRLIMESMEYGIKRRSARVRNTLKKHQEHTCVNYQDLLKKFLPPSLCDIREDPDEETSAQNEVVIYTIEESGANDIQEEENKNTNSVRLLSSTETEDVKKFLTECQKNGGVLDLLYRYLIELSSKTDLLWPAGLADVYIAAYVRARVHFTLPSLFSQSTSFESIKDQGMMTLTYMEFKLDKWYTKSHPTTFSSVSQKCAPNHFGPEFLDKHFMEDMDYLLQMSVLKCALGDYLPNFVMRVLWLKGRFYTFEGDIDISVGCFEHLASIIQDLEEKNKCPMKQALINSASMNIISKEHVKEQLELLQHCQSLEEVHKLYDQGNYQSVVDLLVPTFQQVQARRKMSNDGNVPDRQVQLCLLQDSLWKLENYQECLVWGEVSFDEAMNQYMSVITASERAVWAETMGQLLSSLNRCVNLDEKLLEKLEKSKLLRFANNLISLISLQMIVAETALESDIPTVSPWILLYQIIKREELKAPSEIGKSFSKSDEKSELITADTIAKQNQQEGDFGLGMPSSLMLLFTAHECLGRFSWCTGSDGALLLLSVEVMSSELQKSTPSNPNPFREDLESGLEQCFYCLYGHPNKRTKAKHLQEHNAQMIKLTWERALLLFEYYKPNLLPEFDSYRTNTVSAELENLLRRVLSLVPSEEDPVSKLDSLMAYIEGGTDKYPDLLSGKLHTSPIVRSLYYLLGDYYFKNKEFGKAIKFYMLDLCINSDRFDSWGGMALARSSQLEQKLGCCDLKNEGAVYRKSTSALRCFKHALELDSTHICLWIEYGSIAYMLHSHTSRQLKQQTQFNFGDDVLELLIKKKKEMLEIAENCFISANCCENEGIELEEVWLHHYMLGKIAEKKNDHPKVYLEHYKQAAQYLHEDEARYPKKIHYHNPPELSIEALEIYYRIHASILKYLLKNEEDLLLEDDLELFQSYLTEVAVGPFAKFQEKRESERDSRYNSLSSSEAEESTLAVPMAKRTKKATAVAIDHDYFQGQKQIPIHNQPESVFHRVHRVSIDSSSESQDSAAVKDLLNSIVAVVAESCGYDENQGGPTIVLGDHKIRKVTNLKDETFNNTSAFCTVGNNNSSDNDHIQQQLKELENAKCINRIDNANTETIAQMTENITLPNFQDKFLQLPVELIVPHENILNVEETIDELLLPKRKLDQIIEKPFIPKREIIDITGESELELQKQSELLEGENIEIREKIPLTVEGIIEQCLTALKNCLQRFTQHYKSLYRIAHYYCFSSRVKNYRLSREVLLGTSNGQNIFVGHPGLFSERKNTNFFNGIWRIPIDEIDRPGSFGAHMYRSIVLLIEVLYQLKDNSMLLHLTVQLSRIPDLGKKYLRDTDRTYLARESFTKCLNVLRDQLNDLLQEEPPPEESRLISCLLDIYRTWQSLQKAAVFPELANELLEEAYRMYKLGEVDRSPPVLEQAIRFCQLQQLKQSNSQIMQDLSRNLVISGILVKPAENVTDGLAASYTAVNSATTTTPTTNEMGQSAKEQNLETLATLIVSQNSTLSLTYISSAELQSNKAVAASSQVAPMQLNRPNYNNPKSYVTYPLLVPEFGATVHNIAEPASAMNVIGGNRYVTPSHMYANTMRKRWQTHGGRRHRFGFATPKPFNTIPFLAKEENKEHNLQHLSEQKSAK